VPAAAVSFECFGVRAELAAEDSAFAAALTDALPTGARPGGNGGTRFTLRRDGTLDRDGIALEIPEHVSDPVVGLSLAVRQYVAEHAPEHVFLHAGVVAVGGVGIVIPAATMSGKSVLVEALVRAGALYVSDEYAAVAGDGRLHPYPKPIVLRPGTVPFGTVDIPPHQIATGPVKPGLVVLTRYEPGATWSPTEVTPGEGALALLEHAVPPRSRARETLRAVTQLARSCRILAGARGEAPPAAGRLIEIAQDQMQSARKPESS
jgi:hypothetical protein